MRADLIHQLVDAFDGAAVQYCHWKENYRLEQSLAGEDDLEILVDRHDGGRASSILEALGFRPAQVTGEEATPGIFHFFGLDAGSGQVIHVHLYTRLLTGESLVKSHWLPVERLLLENRREVNGIQVPSKSAELIIHLLRVFVKYGSTIDLFFLQREADAYARELHWLEDGADRAEVFRLLQAYAVPIEATLFAQCWASLHAPTELIERIRLGYAVRRGLRRYERHRAVERNLLYARLLLRYGIRRFSGPRSGSGKRPAAGGALIAVVGPEATGKSTVVAECHRWIAPAFEVRTIHVGKPASTLLTLPLNAGLAFGRLLRRPTRARRSIPPKSTSADPAFRWPSGGIWSLLAALRAVALAWDRSAQIASARRLAAAGGIVICDRYPSRIAGAVDSPRLRWDSARGGVSASAYRWLARIEERLYAQIPPPDLVLRLGVSLATAKQRNRDRLKADKEDDAYLEFRHQQSTRWERPDACRVRDIDTEQSLIETLRQAKLAIWEAL